MIASEQQRNSANDPDFDFVDDPVKCEWAWVVDPDREGLGKKEGGEKLGVRRSLPFENLLEEACLDDSKDIESNEDENEAENATGHTSRRVTLKEALLDDPACNVTNEYLICSVE
ncbi:uncharacterized protein RCC_05406 [Ramularia collo-cygni]|uniref:Uncharacterized protein n=1 Tax=Ramularia collo-cygni TaxID=112498 RepID=A0A2D3UYS8_9PEZI|nr:uncharacterized protein RCC_05406 [Ramularia collo-cygni]CZT19555.1 uncharacterized protein RCC_05406 [Ramularia collo-cygni]